MDTVFSSEVKVNALDIYTYPIGKAISTHREELWVDYPSLPVTIGFSLSSMQNPLGNLTGIRFFGPMYGGIAHQGYGKIAYSLIVAMIGYGLTLGLWISRNGIYEVKKPTIKERYETQRGNSRLQ